jgi:5-methylcytosine-specific restriction enzyme subunit McrC
MTVADKIPIQNIYYLLCYAWNRLEQRDIVDVERIDSTNLVDLFAKILISGTQHLLKRGLDRGYIPQSEDTKTLRGKIDFGSSLKRNLFNKAQAHCHFDEFSHNVLHNQILKSTIWQLICVDTIDEGLEQELVGLYRRLHGIDRIKLNRGAFKKVQLHRNNMFYSFLLNICELIFYNLLPSEDPGRNKFRSFFQDEKQMAALFEDFIRNFYTIECPDIKVRREGISWNAQALDDISASYLPKMTTDISMQSESAKAVIDAKFYKKALSDYFDSEKIHAANLYQIFAYIKNLEVCGGLNEECSGMLLYPCTDKMLSLNYKMGNHKIMIRTLNLNQPWRNIHADLMQIADDALRGG